MARYGYYVSSQVQHLVGEQNFYVIQKVSQDQGLSASGMTPGIMSASDAIFEWTSVLGKMYAFLS